MGAINELVTFARQRSGIEFANYGEIKSFRAEQRSITKDLHEFNKALRDAELAHITNQDVVEAAPRAFSGRLEWKNTHQCKNCGKYIEGGESPAITDCEMPTHFKGIKPRHEWNTRTGWHYCTGQYFPTEYRKAATSVLRQAIENSRRKWAAEHPTTSNTITTIAELKELARANGSHWFDKDTMRFFRGNIESGIIAGKFFISSEQFSDETARKYTVRTFNEKGEIDEMPGTAFQQFNSKAEARAAIKQHIQGNNKAA